MPRSLTVVLVWSEEHFSIIRIIDYHQPLPGILSLQPVFDETQYFFFWINSSRIRARNLEFLSNLKKSFVESICIACVNPKDRALWMLLPIPICVSDGDLRLAEAD